MKIHWLVLLLFSLCGAAHADRDIVYAARYYAPPGSHGDGSHFHIYRINPDGTGTTQLTFGAGDEATPQWSPDGRQILFAACPANSDAWTLCRMDADGRDQQRLEALKDGAWPPKPATPGYKLENDGSATDPDIYTLIALKTGRRLRLTVPDPGIYGDDALLPMPGGGLVYAANQRNSTSHENYFFYRINAATGKLRYLTEGQFLAWSPDGSRYCVAPCRDTMPYEKRKVPLPVDPSESAKERSGDKYLMIWIAPLYVRIVAGGPMKQITPRLSYVTGADWRKGT